MVCTGIFGCEVPDPFRQDRSAFERALAFIEHELEKAFWSPRP